MISNFHQKLRSQQWKSFLRATAFVYSTHKRVTLKIIRKAEARYLKGHPHATDAPGASTGQRFELNG